MMEDDKFDRLLREIGEIRKSHQDSDAKLDGTLKDFRKEISAAQEKTTKELSLKISKSGYTFQKKGHEHQFNFNSGVQESIASACNEIQKLSSNPSDKDALSKADAHLDEGEKALSKRQKHIMIADGSDWGTVRHYEADPLADDSDDEKRIKRPKKASKKEMENAGITSRKRRGGGHGGGYRRRRPQWMEYGYKRDSYLPPTLMATGPHYQQRPQMGQYRNRPRVLGPCFTCGGYGHLAASLYRKCPS